MWRNTHLVRANLGQGLIYLRFIKVRERGHAGPGRLHPIPFAHHLAHPVKRQHARRAVAADQVEAEALAAFEADPLGRLHSCAISAAPSGWPT